MESVTDWYGSFVRMELVILRTRFIRLLVTGARNDNATACASCVPGMEYEQ